MTRILFDVDTGVDDALAILLTLGHPDAEVVGIGTVAGNVNVDLGTTNSVKVLELAGRTDIPVARGCERPLVEPYRDASAVHGNDGLGNSGYPPPSTAPSKEHAVDQMIRLAGEHPGELTLVAVGPLTNVAVALLREPRLPELLRSVVVMGGAFAHPGNVNATAEFNISVDPEAAQAVFEAPFDLTVVPLDATMQVLLDETHLAALGPGTVPDFLRAMTKEYLDYEEAHTGRRVGPMHDPLAGAIAIDRSLMLHAEDVPVTVETSGRWTRGLTVADRRPGVPRPNSPPGRATVCFEPDADRFFAEFFPFAALPRP